MPYRFHGQRANEEVVLFTRQHPFVLLHPFLISALLLLFPFFIYLFTDANSVLFYAFVAGVAAAALHGWLAWYSWSNTVLMVTNERIVLLRQRSMFHREFSECDLANIQQLSHEVKGIIHTMLGYGDIAVYTGGAQMAFLIPKVPDPYEIQQEILRIRAGEGLLVDGGDDDEDEPEDAEPKEDWLD